MIGHGAIGPRCCDAVRPWALKHGKEASTIDGSRHYMNLPISCLWSCLVSLYLEKVGSFGVWIVHRRACMWEDATRCDGFGSWKFESKQGLADADTMHLDANLISETKQKPHEETETWRMRCNIHLQCALNNLQQQPTAWRPSALCPGMQHMEPVWLNCSAWSYQSGGTERGLAGAMPPPSKLKNNTYYIIN